MLNIAQKSKVSALALLVIIASSTISSDRDALFPIKFLSGASAQNVAGKIASRPKVVGDASLSKKKKGFWRRGGKVVSPAEEEDGEWCNGTLWETFCGIYSSWEYFWSFAWSFAPYIESNDGVERRKSKSGKSKGGNGDLSWELELLLAESQMILMALGISILFAILSWILHVQREKREQRKNTQGNGEDGGKYNTNLVLAPFRCHLCRLGDLMMRLVPTHFAIR